MAALTMPEEWEQFWLSVQVRATAVKMMFARLLIVWLVVGQVFFVFMSHFKSGPPSLLELDYARHPSPASQAALERELNRVTDYETKRTIGMVTLLLAVDGLIIGLFWNFGANRKDVETQG
jgi:hypothetical protein